MPNDEIISLKDRIVEQLSPLKVYLFGSFADGTSKEDSQAYPLFPSFPLAKYVCDDWTWAAMLDQKVIM